MTIALRVISASRTLKKTVATGLVDGVRARITPAGLGTSTSFRSCVDAHADEVLVAVALGDPPRAGLVLALLIGDHAHPGLLYGQTGKPFRVLVGRLGGGLDDRRRARAVIGGKRARRPAGPLEHHPRSRSPGRVGRRGVADARLAHAHVRVSPLVCKPPRVRAPLVRAAAHA